MPDIVVRSGGSGDLAGLLEIRNDAVRHTTAVWTETPVTPAECADWLAELIGRDALVVAEDRSAHGSGAVAGYGSYFPWRAKEGYRYTVEDSVYVRAGYQGLGVGRALLTETVRRARDAGAHVLIAAMEAGNTASLRLHESVGFEPVGTFAEVGYKFGRWLDLTQLRLALGPPGPPAPRH